MGTRIADSCEYGVPLYEFERHRSQLPDWVTRKGTQGLGEYQEGKNQVSLDGLPALRWPEENESEPIPDDQQSRRPSRR
jgi:hypothetical protein